MKPFFSNLKVIELAGVLAGPSVGVFFAELGAKVIKIENPKTKGDVTRSWKSFNGNPYDKESAYYWSVNTGKEVLFLDISQESELQKFYALIKDADILITNFLSQTQSLSGLCGCRSIFISAMMTLHIL